MTPDEIRERFEKQTDDGNIYDLAAALGWTELDRDFAEQPWCGRHPNGVIGEVPDYLSDGNAMLESIEAMREKGHSIGLMGHDETSSPPAYTVRFIPPDGGKHMSFDDTLPRAVALAALDDTLPRAVALAALLALESEI